MSLKNYNKRIVENFNEWLRDNYDSAKICDLEFCADEILLKCDIELYESLLKRYIHKHNIFAESGALLDMWGDKLEDQDEALF